MGVLYYEDFETAEETHEREQTELSQSNRNYTGRRLPDRAPRREDSSEDEEAKVSTKNIEIKYRKKYRKKNSETKYRKLF